MIDLRSADYYASRLRSLADEATRARSTSRTMAEANNRPAPAPPEKAQLKTESSRDSISGQYRDLDLQMKADLQRMASGEIKLHIGYLTTQPAKFWEMPEDQYQAALSRLQPDIEQLKRAYTRPPSAEEEDRFSEDSRRSPALMPYAKITIAGQVVAEINNQGGTIIYDDSLAERIRELLPNGRDDIGGPDLAQERAESIAKITGGRLVKSDTAISQSAFESLPPLTPPEPSIDWEGLRKEQERLQSEAAELKQKRAEYLAQQKGATTGA